MKICDDQDLDQEHDIWKWTAYLICILRSDYRMGKFEIIHLYKNFINIKCKWKVNMWRSIKNAQASIQVYCMLTSLWHVRKCSRLRLRMARGKDPHPQGWLMVCGGWKWCKSYVVAFTVTKSQSNRTHIFWIFWNDLLALSIWVNIFWKNAVHPPVVFHTIWQGALKLF